MLSHRKLLVIVVALSGCITFGQFGSVEDIEEDAPAEYEGYVDERIVARLNQLAADYDQLMGRTGKFLLWRTFNPQPYQQQPSPVYRPMEAMPRYETFDFVVVGSGSSGAVVASRLSENPKWKVLLLEVGKPSSFITDIPALCATFQLTGYNWGYLMEKQDNMALSLEEQRMAWPRGRVLGGTSVINYMIHVRGNRRDYDRWAALGNPGWSYAEVLPYFQKLEDAAVEYTDGARYRSRGGPVGVQDVPYRTGVVHAYLKSSMEAGHRYVDYNGKRQMGTSYVQSTTRRGRRSSVEAAYLRPIRDRPNLTILTESRAIKLLFEGTRVSGVQYVRNRQFHYANISKEVIISAGTFNSPQLLMLSGIGPRAHLNELGIPVLRDLPVGQKMYDHATFVGLSFVVNESIAINYEDLYDLSNLRRFVDGYGPLTSLGGVEALTYLKTNVSRDVDKYPDMELIFIGGSFATDGGLVYRRTFRINDATYNAIWRPLEPIHNRVWSVFPMLVHPASYGHIKLKSRNPYHWPKLYGNFFTDPSNLDIKTFIAAIREVQHINRQPTLQKFNSQQVSTKIPGCAHHVWDTDPYWECALRHITGTLHHQVSTVKMGPTHDPEAVVDHRLRVYGVQGLRVADCSIVPLPLTAHTNVPAMMIGEKAADLIKEDWRL